MWDPRTYDDTDYGLDEGESFEPEFDPDDAPLDRSMPHIMTVLGPIEPEELGVCLPATRFLPRTVRELSERDRARALAAAVEELEAFASVGGRSVVDITTAATGRDIAALKRLTQLVPSHLIVATGIAPNGGDPDRTLHDELTEGLEGTGVRPGLLAIREHDLTSDDAPRHALELAMRHGLPILVTLSDWDHAGRVLAARRGMLADRDETQGPHLLLMGPNGVPDPGLVTEAKRAGAFMAVRLPGPGHPAADEVLARRLVDLARKGLDQALLVTMGIVSDALPSRSSQEPRTPYLIDRFALALMDAGSSALGVRQIMIENPARALTTVPTA